MATWKKVLTEADILDEDNMSSDSATAVASQQSIKAYVDASIPTEATNVTVTGNNSTDETVYLTFVDGSTGTQGIETDTNLIYNPSSNMLEAGIFNGTIKIAGHTMNDIDITSEATDADDHLMSAAAIKARIDDLKSATTFNIAADSDAANLNVDSKIVVHDETMTFTGGTAIDTTVTGGQTITFDLDLSELGNQGSCTIGSDYIAMTIGGATAKMAPKNLFQEMDQFTGDDTLSIGDAGNDMTLNLRGNVTVGGNLTVNGGTTTISTTQLVVEDEKIILGKPDSDFADDAAAVSANSGGGIALVTDSQTASNYAQLTWITGKNQTGWCVEANQSSDVYEIASMGYSNNSAPGNSDDENGVGGFIFDTGTDTLYIRTA
ncbi:MAG: hypothetical protein Unbinned5123contig1000_7 [Prokaryotic dsDNA virus sp.]|nr:MAG: hypothetical protein Unbinned5123contig1000_7 [Prokaryotic dsDNA virus sp.]|tara:strand:- start:1457 stop:2590 length:1134 start_codon:yes stop_codon:yes gene_type:complete